MEDYKTKIHDHNGRIIGEVKGKIFYKSIAPNHFLRKPPAIAFDTISLDEAESVGAFRVEVTDRETGTKYKATIAHIRRAGFQFNRGFGDQIGLPLSGWIRQDKGDLIQSSLFDLGIGNV